MSAQQVACIANTGSATPISVATLFSTPLTLIGSPSPQSLLFAGSPTSKGRECPSTRSCPPREPRAQHLGALLALFRSGLSPRRQDEMELGYVQAPHKTLPVVFDSPRNGELQGFPYKRILVSWGGASLGTESTYPGDTQVYREENLFCRVTAGWPVTV